MTKIINVVVEDIFEKDTKVAKTRPLSDKRPGFSGGVRINNDVSEEVIKTLLEYIALLKDEIRELKNNL